MVKNNNMAFVYFFFVILSFFLTSIVCQIGASTPEADTWQDQKLKMVSQLKKYGIRDERVLMAMTKIDRHRFIPQKYRKVCNPYGDHPCPIGYGQTISQPFIVAYMTEKLNLKRGDKVLEIGTGSGYQAAVLAELGADVFSIEIRNELVNLATTVLKNEGYGKVNVIHGSGYFGHPENAPYDAIIVTCAPKEIPKTLLKELKDGGRMIIPVGSFFQELMLIRKKQGDILVNKIMDVRFVPMIKSKKKDKG